MLNDPTEWILLRALGPRGDVQFRESWSVCRRSEGWI
jgi:hypothetical protein